MARDQTSLPPVPTPVPMESIAPTEHWQLPPLDAQQRLVLPLMHREEMLGLLVIHRRDERWGAGEMGQLEAIASGLAMACLLDQQQNWYQRAWQEEKQRSAWEREHWADLLHQLRNPLTALRTFSRLLLKRWQGNERDQQVVEGIVRQGEHLQELMQSFEAQQRALLALPPEGLEVEVEVVPVEGLALSPLPLAEVLGPIVQAQQAIAEEQGIKFINHLTAPLPIILGEAPALREVLSNLLDNALKYTPSGGLVQLLPIDGQTPWWALAIADTGYGIPLEEQDRIFDRYYRGQQQQGTIAGTGLGLAIVRDLVEQMGGKISVTSPNQLDPQGKMPGTTFTLWLQRADVAPLIKK